jgi:ribonuclease D
VAVDTETMGLAPHRDRLCLVQLSSGDGTCHLVQFSSASLTPPFAAPNLRAVLTDPYVIKLCLTRRYEPDPACTRCGVDPDGAARAYFAMFTTSSS